MQLEKAHTAVVFIWKTVREQGKIFGSQIEWFLGNPDPDGTDNSGSNLARHFPLKLSLQYIIITIMINTIRYSIFALRRFALAPADNCYLNHGGSGFQGNSDHPPPSQCSPDDWGSTLLAFKLLSNLPPLLKGHTALWLLVFCICPNSIESYFN
jgi:hypothetical protein